MEQSFDHCDLQERRRDKSQELQADLWSSTSLQTLQAGFRKTFRTTDHVLTYKLILKKKRRVEDGHVGGSNRFRFHTA